MQSSSTHVHLGRVLQRRDCLDEAIIEYRLALQLEPDNADAHYRLGTALHAKRQWDTAIAECSEAIRLQPDLVGAYNGAAASLYQKGRQTKDRSYLDLARSRLMQALEMRPGSAVTLHNLGEIEWALGNGEAAIKAMQAAVDADSSYQRAYMILARMQLRRGRWRGAWKTLLAAGSLTAE